MIRALRWVCVLPGAVLAAAVGYLVSRVVIRYAVGMVLIAPPDWIGVRILVDGGSHLVLGAAAIYAGIAIMPSQTARNFIGFTGLIVMVVAAILALALATFEWWGVYALVAVIVGAAMTGRVLVADLRRSKPEPAEEDFNARIEARMRMVERKTGKRERGPLEEPEASVISMDVRPVSAEDPLVGLETLVLWTWLENSPTLRMAYRSNLQDRARIENLVRLRYVEKCEAELDLRAHGLSQVEADNQTAPIMWIPPTWPL